MKRDKLILKSALNNMHGFKEGVEYLYLGEDDKLEKCGVYVSDYLTKETCSNNNFKLSSIKNSIKDVICIYEGSRKTLTLFDTYSVYKYSKCDDDDNYIDRYDIIDDNLNFSRYPCDYFMNIDEFEEIKNREDFDKIIKEKVDRIIEINKLDKELPKKKELINDIIDLVSEKNNVAPVLVDENKINNSISSMKFYCGLTIATAFTNLIPKPFGFVVGGLFGLYSLSATYRYIKLKRKELYTGNKVDISNSVRECNNLEQINNLPLETLGKIKYIENNIIILNKMNVSEDILKLIKESVDLTLLLMEYESNDITAKKINDFLDNTINYVKTLKNNKHIEEKYIKEELAKNINDIIDKNSAVFKSMVDDNKYIMEQFKTN